MKKLLKLETRLIKGLTLKTSIIFSLLLILIFTSCQKENANPIIGKWIVENDTTNTSIVFSNQNNLQTFTASGILENNLNGNWTIEQEKIILEYSPALQTAVDSLNFEQTLDGDHILSLFLNGKEVNKMENGEFKTETAFLNFDYQLADNNLKLTSPKGNISFSKYVIPQNTISFNSIFRGIVGMIFLLITAWLFSSNRKNINWTLVGKGLVLQILIAIAVLKLPFVESIFDVLSKGFVSVIAFTNEGVNFLFGQFGIGTIQSPLLNFAFTILPTIIFFSALVSLFYYYGILQKIVYVFAWIMKKFMSLSGAESLAAAGNVFLGQTESPLLVKPYLGKMTKSEIMCLMTGGMATIAGGVLAAYVGFLGGDDPVQQAFFAKHLLTASIISAPAAIIAAKILVPETEEINQDLKVDKTKIGTNALEAISNGTTDGLKLAINVGAMLLVFISLMALGNGALHLIGEIGDINTWIIDKTPYKDGLTFQFILGYIGRPIVWLLGVSWADSVFVGELLGTKTVLNEFVGYMRLGELKNAGLLSEKSTIMSTYILCGFANFASIGIQIGGIGALIPNKKGLLSKLGIKALIGGTIACLMTAAIVGMMY